MKTKLLIIGFCLAFFVFAPKAMAYTCLWTAASSTAPTAWNNAGNWSGCNSVVPTSADDVVFDNSAGTYTLNLITTAGTAKSIDFTGAGANLVTFSGTASLTVDGNITAQSGMTWSHSGGLIITGISILTSNSVAFGTSVLINGVSADVSLGDNFTNSVASKNFQITRGTLNTSVGNYNIDTSLFGDTGGGLSKILTLNSSTINATAVIFYGTAPTITTTDHTININSNSATANNFAGQAWGKINFKSNASAARAHAITFGTGASFVEFNIDQLTDRRDVSISFSGDFSVASSSTWKSGGIGNDNPTYRMLIKSSAIGTARTMTVTAASKTITLQDVDVQDIVIALTNSPTVTGTRVGDAGGGSNMATSTPKTVYADCGIANVLWTDNIWATSSGGGDNNLNNYPLSQDTAVIDNATWDDTGNILNSGNYVRLGNVDASGLTEVQNFQHGGGVVVYGSLTFTGSGFTVAPSYGGATIIFDARVKTTLVVNSSDDTDWGSDSIIIQSYGGTVQLASALTHTGTFTLTQGTLDLNGQTLTTNIFSSSNVNTRELKDTAGGGKIVINALTGTGLTFATDTGLTVSNAPDIDIGDSNNTLTASTTIAFGSAAKTFGDFKITKHAGDFDVILTGTGHTFGVFTLETPDATYNFSDVAFTAGETYTVSSFVADGTASYLINISSVTAAAHTLSDSGGTNTVTYCNIYNSNAGGGATWNSLTSAGNTDQGGNTGWIFTVAAVGGYDDTTINVYDE